MSGNVFVCEECGESFSSVQGLHIHQGLKHSDEKEEHEDKEEKEKKEEQEKEGKEEKEEQEEKEEEEKSPLDDIPQVIVLEEYTPDDLPFDNEDLKSTWRIIKKLWKWDRVAGPTYQYQLQEIRPDRRLPQSMNISEQEKEKALSGKEDFLEFLAKIDPWIGYLYEENDWEW